MDVFFLVCLGSSNLSFPAENLQVDQPRLPKSDPDPQLGHHPKAEVLPINLSPE